MLPQKNQNQHPRRALKSQCAKQHRTGTGRRLECGEPGLLQQADNCHSKTKADKLRRAKPDYNFQSPWFGG
jgi:hypothetical protein